MINIDTRLMDLVKNKTITSDDFFILLCIAKRIRATKQSFPSINLLQEETNFGRDKIYKCLDSLQKAKLIFKQQRILKSGKFSSNLYTITTKLLGVFITCEDEKIEIKDEVKPLTENQEPLTDLPTTVKPTTVKPTISINKSIEVLTNLSEGGGISQNLDSNISNLKLEEIKEGIVNNPLFELWIDSIETNNPKTKEIKGIRDLAVNDTALALLSEKKYSTPNPKNWLEISYKKLLDIHIQNQRIEKMDQKNQTNRSKVSETPILEQIDYFA
jgi:hypothetical protein